MAERASGKTAGYVANLGPRRRLADNVICMFAEDRPAIVNAPRRGRYPSSVTSPNQLRMRATNKAARIRQAETFKPGDVVKIGATSWGKPYANRENAGRLVRIVKRLYFADGTPTSDVWIVASVDGALLMSYGKWSNEDCVCESDFVRVAPI